MKPSPRTTATLTLGLLTVGLLAGCATAPTTTPTPVVSASREAAWGLDGTNLRLVNNSGVEITVVEDYSDSNSGLGVIPNGGIASVERTAFVGEDVGVQVRFADGRSTDIRASNPIDGDKPPYVTNGSSCGKIEFLVGDQRDYSIGVHGITVKRLPDDGWKQFQVTFTSTVAEGSRNFCTYLNPGTAF